MKGSLFQRANEPEAYGAVFSLSGELLRQVELLEGMLDDLADQDIDWALSKIDWYEKNVVLPEDEKEVEIFKEKMEGQRDELSEKP